MRIPRFASAFRRRLRLSQFSPAALAAMARSPSYRAPAAADLHDEMAAQSPGVDAPLEAWGAKNLVIRNDEVVGMSISGRAFIAAETLFQSRPLSEVRLVAVQPFMGELAKCSHLATLRRLDLSGNRSGAGGAKMLAASPYLDGLRELVLSGNSLGDDGLDLLESAPWFSKLEVLDLADNSLGSRRALLLARRAPSLVSLDLSNNPLGPDALLPLGLQRLALSHCGLGAAGVAKLAASGCFESLEELDLSFNAIGSQTALAPNRKNASGLYRLKLGFNDIGDAGLAILKSFPSLECLDLSANRITEFGASAVADSCPLLQDLNLSANPIGDAGALALLRSEGLSNLSKLNLSNCGITEAGVQRLTVSGTLGGLQSLSLAWNAIGDTGIRSIASCPDLAGLRELDLTGTHLGFAGAIALAESQCLVRLRILRLDKNHRLPSDAVALLRERYTTSS